MSLSLVLPNWPAPSHIKAFTSTRLGGVSLEPWASLNVASHVSDDEASVQANRKLLEESIGLPNPQWLRQTHSIIVVEHDGDGTESDNLGVKSLGAESLEADGCFTSQAEQSCVIMTADCLPVLLCNTSGTWVAAVHAGWRGLADGILVEALKKYYASDKYREPLMAWIGPAISQAKFKVGSEVKEAFTTSKLALEHFDRKENGKYLCDLSGIAQSQLEQANVEVYQSNLCTYTDKQHFFSHRRASHENGAEATTGRMATAIWISKENPFREDNKDKNS